MGLLGATSTSTPGLSALEACVDRAGVIRPFSLSLFEDGAVGSGLDLMARLLGNGDDSKLVSFLTGAGPGVRWKNPSKVF